MAISSDVSSRPYAVGPVAAAGFGLIIALSPIVMVAHGFLALFGFAGLLIVVGGVIATAFMSFAAGDVLSALRSIAGMFRQPSAEPRELTDDLHRILYWARGVRSGGLAALRASLDHESVSNSFVNYGLNMVMSEYSPNEVRAMLRTAADAGYDRDCIPVDVLRTMASHAPAFGMIGTLVGMIAMLCQLDNDIATACSTLAIAFLSTLYGVISARMVYLPAASRLRQEADHRQRRYEMLIEGIVMLAEGGSASHVRDRLNGFLRPEQRDYFDAIATQPAAPAAHSAALVPMQSRTGPRRALPDLALNIGL